MSHFRDSDILAVQQFLQALYGCRRIERFAQTVLSELSGLIGLLADCPNLTRTIK